MIRKLSLIKIEGLGVVWASLLQTWQVAGNASFLLIKGKVDSPMMTIMVNQAWKGMLILAIALFSMQQERAFAHPHAFVECSVSFVMDEKGLVGIRERWILDEMTTVSILDVVDSDRDASLSAEEQRALHDLTLNSLLEFNYFTALSVNGRDTAVTKIDDFSAQLQQNKLVYDFLVPCPVAAVPGEPQQVKLAVYDKSFYSFIVYTDQGGSGIDPSKDPLFSNRNAPARPGDFKRFIQAVGIRKFEGEVLITGKSERFKVVSKVEDAPDMAYFFGQIVPQTFTIQFEPR